MAKLVISAKSAVVEFEKYATGYAQPGNKEWQNTRQTSSSRDRKADRADFFPASSPPVAGASDSAFPKDKANPTKLPPDEAGRLAKRFSTASDDFPDLSALVWFNLTPDVQAGSGVQIDFMPPMFKVSGQRGERRNYCWDREWWSVQLFTDIGDEGRFKLACKRFENLSLQAEVPEVEGRPPAADARLLTFLSDADGVQKFGRHPTDPYLWADPSGKRIQSACPHWDDPNAVRFPAHPGLHGEITSAPMSSAEVMRNGFRPEWWCAHLPNVFQRAAEWLAKSKQSARIDERGTERIQSEEQLGAVINDRPDAIRHWAEDALTRLEPCPDCRTPADAQMVTSALRDFTTAATCRKCGRYKLITDHRMVVANGAGAIVAPTVLVQPGWGAGLRWVEVPPPTPTPMSTPAPNATPSKFDAQAAAGKGKADKEKPGKTTVPSQHRDALNRYLKWKKTCEGRPMIRIFWKEVMAKLPANKFKNTDQERDAFQEWYQNNYKG